MARPDPAAVEYLDDSSELMTGEAVALDLRPTGFVLSAAGAIIDFLVTIGLLLLIELALTSPLISPLFDKASGAAASVVAFVFCLVVVPVVVETATQGKSLGRLAVGARIVRDDGGGIGFRHALIRALTGILEIYSTLGGLAALVGLLNGRSKRVGDYLAGTYSQNERVGRVPQTVWVVPPPMEDWARLADVARMPDRLSRRIAQFLGQAPRLVPAARERLGRELVAEAARFVSPVPPAHPETFLAAVMAVRNARETRALELERAALERVEPALTALPHGFPDRG